MRLEWANTQSKGKGFVPTYVCVCVCGGGDVKFSINFPTPVGVRGQRRSSRTALSYWARFVKSHAPPRLNHGFGGRLRWVVCRWSIGINFHIY